MSEQQEEFMRQWGVAGMPLDKIRLANAAWQAAWQAAKRQDAERIKALEARLDHYTRISEAGYSHGDYLDQWIELAELRAKLEALEKQEPVAEVVEFLGDSMFTVRINRPTNLGEWLYAKPVPATNEGEKK